MSPLPIVSTNVFSRSSSISLVFVIVSITTLIFTKPYIKKRLLTKEKLKKTNVDALIGKEAVVTVDISNAERKGEVLLEGKYWTARATDMGIIKTSSLVIVERIEGVKVIVSPLKTEEEGVN